MSSLNRPLLHLTGHCLPLILQQTDATREVDTQALDERPVQLGRNISIKSEQSIKDRSFALSTSSLYARILQQVCTSAMQLVLEYIFTDAVSIGLLVEYKGRLQALRLRYSLRRS